MAEIYFPEFSWSTIRLFRRNTSCLTYMSLASTSNLPLLQEFSSSHPEFGWLQPMKHGRSRGTDTQHCFYSCFRVTFESEVGRICTKSPQHSGHSKDRSSLYATVHPPFKNGHQKANLVLHVLMAIIKKQKMFQILKSPLPCNTYHIFIPLTSNSNTRFNFFICFSSESSNWMVHTVCCLTC